MKAGMMSLRSKSKKLTTSTTSMGRPKNSVSTETIGATCHQDARSPVFSAGGASSRRDAACSMLVMAEPTLSGRDEFVPAPRQVAILVHHRVPAGDVAHTVPDRT